MCGTVGGVDARVSPRLTIPASEFTWRFSKAPGPGGQHVNTTDTRAELMWDVAASSTLSEGERQRLLTALAGDLVGGVLTVSASEYRSQLRNRQAAVAKLVALVKQGLAPAPRRRRPTKPTRGSVRRHQEAKRRRSDIKRLRRRPSAE